jgi:hypothetical protein
LAPADEIVVLKCARPPVVLDDDMQLGDYLAGQSYQDALVSLRDARDQR